MWNTQGRLWLRVEEMEFLRKKMIIIYNIVTHYRCQWDFVLGEAFSGHCETSRKIVDSSNLHCHLCMRAFSILHMGHLCLGHGTRALDGGRGGGGGEL